MKSLFKPFQAGDITFGNRIVMAPLARRRAENAALAPEDLIAFGKTFISNPDLVERLKKGALLAEPDKDTFYHGGAKGYVDYPVWKPHEDLNE